MTTKYDIYFQPVPPERVSGFKCVEFGFTAALKVTGFRSLITRWLKTLLTPIGSDPLYPEEGTEVGNLIGANISQLSTEIQDSVALGVIQANEQVKAQDLEGLYDDDERLQSAEIDRYVEAPAGFEVWIAIENMAGTRLSIPAITLGTARN